MSSGISFTCDSCGREVFGCNIVNGMKFCAKCYQETFGNQQNKESNELLVNSLAEKDKQIAELKKQLEEKEKTIQGLIEAQKYLEESASYQMFLDIQKQLEEKEKKIEKLRKLHSIRDDASQCEIVNGVKFNAEQIMIIALLKENMTLATNERIKELEKQLKSQPAEIVEKIKNYKGEYFEWKIGDKIYPAFKITEEDLDNILKEYQK